MHTQQPQRVDAVIVGAGVVGLACAAKLSARGDSVLVLEQHARVGQETSSRNSGVIHAGLYYPQDSLKARLCVRGRELAYARAARNGIPHRKLGKLIVAVDDAETAALEQLAQRAAHHGTSAVCWIDAREIHRREPRVRAVAGLWSPETGIVDAHALVHDYLREAQADGTALALRTHFVAIEPAPIDDLCVIARGADGCLQRVHAGAVINAAGLHAFDVAASAGITAGAMGLAPHFCKGDYFRLCSRLRGLISHLVYPMPTSAGLGVHLTLDLDGGLRAGPDTEYVDSPRYDVDENKQHAFADALRRYVPEIRDEDLAPDFAGVRPKLHGPEASFHDFVISDARAHGLPRLINLLGIESPGLTASEAIAEHVAALLPR